MSFQSGNKVADERVKLSNIRAKLRKPKPTLDPFAPNPNAGKFSTSIRTDPNKIRLPNKKTPRAQPTARKPKEKGAFAGGV